MDVLKIYISTHLPGQIINNDLYQTINLKEEYPTFNRIFSEYCTMHYVYHNNLHSDYVGFCSYKRKVFEFQMKPIQNSIQYFYCNDESFEIEDGELSYLKHWCEETNSPTSLYDDVCEYLQGQNTISYDKVLEYFNNENFTLYSKEIFITDYSLFETLVNFIDNYIYFIKEKYSIQSEDDWKNHIINTYINRHRELFYQIVGNNYDGSRGMLYQTEDDFNNIFNDDYGFDADVCNSWRIYSYMIEILISLFIYSNEHHEFILNNDNEMSTFNMLQHQYDDMWKLLEINQPLNICEFGYGPSTLIFNKYIQDKENGNVISINYEDFNLTDNTSIEISGTTYDNVNIYDNLEEYLTGLGIKFDFVFIDGPYSWYDYLDYGRVQILDFIDYDLLSDSGIFMIHDSERKTTKRTIDVFLEKLSNKNYKYVLSYSNKGQSKELLTIQYYK